MPGQKIVAVPGVGNVAFPDTMSDDDIGKAIQSQQPPPEPSGWQKFGNWMANTSGATNAIQNLKTLPSEIQNAPATVKQNIQTGLNQTPAEARLRWEQMGSPVAAQPVSALASGASVGGAAATEAARFMPSAVAESRAVAGKAIGAVEDALESAHVDPTPALQYANRLQEMSDAGKPMPGVARKLLDRFGLSQTPTAEPPQSLTFKQARDFYKSARDLSIDEQTSLNNEQKGVIAAMAHSLGDEIQKTAAAAGQGENYATAMSEFAHAATIQEKMGVLQKWGIKAGLGLLGAAGAGAAGAAGYSIYRDLSK